MKPEIHPEYRYVVFRDINTGNEFVTRSCVTSRETTEFEGQEYPLVVLDVSSESHPFYTGTQRIMDTEGRVERFMRKYGFGGGDGEQAADEAPAGGAPADEAPADDAPDAAPAEEPSAEA